MKRWVLVLFCLALCSCGAPELNETSIQGLWIEDAENLRIEFTPNLYSKRKPNEPVEVGLWTIKDEEIVMRSLTGDEVTAWRPRMEKNGFVIDKTEAQFRTFRKLKSEGSVIDEGLVGLWRSYGDHPQFVEFTDRGTFAAVFRRLDKPDGEIYAVGCQADVLTAGQSKFYLEGYLGSKRIIRGVNAHPYELEGENLVWKPKHKGQKEITYRKVSVVDLQEFAAKGEPGAE